jgi:AcrR family transcriptional regulator
MLRAPSKRLPTAERRARIVRAAITCFGRRGFAGTTTKMLAEEAEVSEALVYRHFPDKRSLYRAIIDQTIRQPERGYYPVAAASKRDDRRVLRSIAGALLKRVEDAPEIMRLAIFSGLEGNPVAKMLHERRGKGLLGFLSSYLARRMAEGAMRPVDPEVAARGFLGMVIHHLHVKHVLGLPVSRRPAEELVDMWVDLFVEGIRR